MPIRPPCGTSAGSGGPTEAIEHTGSPTTPAAAMRRAAATAAGEVYQEVVGPVTVGPVGRAAEGEGSAGVDG